MDEYKTQIEDIVVPIYISARDKNALRRELWNHVVETATHMIEEGASERVAYENAIGRLGTPEEIRDAHHSEQSVIGLWMNWFDVWVYPYERRTWKASIIGLGGLALGVALSMIPFVMILAPFLSTRMTFEKLAVLLTIYPFLILWLYALVLCITAQPRPAFELASLHGRYASLKATFRLWLYAVLALPLMALCIGANYAVLGAVIGFNAPKLIEFVYIAPFVYLFPWFSTVLATTVGLEREAKTCGAIPDWPYRYS